MSARSWSGLLVFLFAVACDARFVDERPRPSDAGAADAGASLARDGGATAAADAGEQAASDAGATVDADLARGTFEGRAGHSGAGAARLVRRATGAFELVFEMDFAVTEGPGTVVVLTTRDALGTMIDSSAGDVEVAAIGSSSGARTYALAADPGARRYVFIFCKPFGVEFARARLVDVM